MLQFSIKDLEKFSGIKSHTIRIWEQRYSFLSPSRSDTNIRYYSNRELKVLLDVSLLNKYGFKISNIDKMPNEDVEKVIGGLNDPQAYSDNIIHKLILNMVEMNMLAFEQCVDEYTKLNDINSTINNLIYPFLQRTKFLLKKTHPANKCLYIFSGIIRQKIISLINQQKTSTEKGKTVLAFLPEGDYYEIDLLCTQLLLKNNSINVIYLGTNVPLKDVLRISEYKKTDFIYTHLNNNNYSLNADKLFQSLNKLTNESEVIITGDDEYRNKKMLSEKIVFRNSVNKALDYILSK